jgi:two-component system cell cycle sensor histidine kinase/response regulator CckA
MAVTDPAPDRDRNDGPSAREVQLQEQLRQAQKLESLGRLAGGIAHDFNAHLSIVFGYADMALEQVADDDPLREPLRQIRMAAERLSGLTNQLLAFSRRQVVQPREVDLNALVEGLAVMLRRILGPSVTLETRLRPDLWPVKMDRGQLEQVIINLAVNARDAMPGGGRLTIETANVPADQRPPSLAGVTGDALSLSVSDTGVGMDQETVARIFEPFFTTKPAGSGSGLGLSTVYGIVHQNQGSIQVVTEPGHGSTFQILLPRLSEVSSEAAPPRLPEPIRSGSETILLVEDNSEGRLLYSTMLRRLGYTVIDVAEPGEALGQLAEHGGEIALLMTDAILPEMSGWVLIDQARRLKPDMAVLMSSGYEVDALSAQGLVDAGTPYLQKPFDKQQLATAVRAALDARR